VFRLRCGPGNLEEALLFFLNLTELPCSTPATWYLWRAVDLEKAGRTNRDAVYLYNGVRVVCNPRGYGGSDANPEFRNDLIIVLPANETALAPG
jgi:hypothetical protein